MSGKCNLLLSILYYLLPLFSMEDSTTTWQNPLYPLMSRYCLLDSYPLLAFNPETSSRVTLASLGTVFQTALTVLARLRLSRHVQNLSRITLMRRICSFHGFFSFGFVCACRGAGIFTDYHLLGTVFQTDQLFCGLVVLWFNCIEGRFGWKPIPSAARVTRDAVSGLPIIHGELSGRQYHTICSLAFVSLAMFKIYHG